MQKLYQILMLIKFLRVYIILGKFMLKVSIYVIGIVIVIINIIRGWGEFGFIRWGFRGSAFVSFLFYVNVS